MGEEDEYSQDDVGCEWERVVSSFMVKDVEIHSAGNVVHRDVSSHRAQWERTKDEEAERNSRDGA